MRPPVQAAALQQHQHEQQQHIHQSSQQQQQEATSATLPAINQQQQHFHEQKLQQSQQRISKFQQHLVEEPVNFRSSSTAATYRNQQQQPQNRHHYATDAIQLFDLNSTLHEFARTHNRHSIPSSCNTRPHSLNSEYASYSRSSSSEDGSYCISERDRRRFDDPAEHFIINFPAADSPTHDSRSNVADEDDALLGLHLPLSETEPLLTNITPTLGEKQRTFSLSKNSASLIFTRKELSATQPQTRRLQRNNSYHHEQQQLQFANSNNNIVNIHKRGEEAQLKAAASATATVSRQKTRRQHSRKQTSTSTHWQQHHQQHRHSLQLNYNNNLISNSACSSNNNICCATNAYTSHCNRIVGASPSTAGITAAVTRKQHAYSWYAPVYSALEEELEQDSRDSSPIHNLANTKKHHSHHYQHRSVQNAASAVSDNETVALLESRTHINIQAPLQLQTQTSNQGKRFNSSTSAAPNSLPLQSAAVVGDLLSSAATVGGYDGEAPQAGSLGLAGGPLPRRKRWENFFKTLVGIRPSSGRAGADASSFSGDNAVIMSPQVPASPEITITRTPSEQNIVIMRDGGSRWQQAPPPPAATQHKRQHSSTTEKLTEGAWLQSGSSTSSLNVVQQKLWNFMRREGSAASLHQEKSQSIVQYRGLRKCETVLALTRQTSSLCSPVLGVGPGIVGGAGAHAMGSGIFSASGVEQIRPLNRLRSSVSTLNATCSRCSSLLSLAASGSRYSLNMGAAGASVAVPHSLSMSQYTFGQHQQQQQPPQLPSSSLSSSHNRSRSNVNIVAEEARCSRKSTASNSSSISAPSNLTTRTNYTPSTSPTSITAPIKVATAALGGFPPPAIAVSVTNSQQPITVSALLSMSPPSSATASSSSSSSEEDAVPVSISAVNVAVRSTSSASSASSASSSSASSTKHHSRARKLRAPSIRLPAVDCVSSAPTATTAQSSSQPTPTSAPPPPPAVAVRSFELFTCKLCLIDVETAEESTTLLQCGCQFCTECMKAYIEFEISEGAYDISCPDAQCPAQGIITLPEIANLTTANLLKKHHRYRLNREIELDKSRTWCPRAGCETVCLVGSATNTDAEPSTSNAQQSAVALSVVSPASVGGSDAITQQLCAVQCPSCKDEFCSACKKTWHPNLTCEENSRRLVADGQDDIGIPFDNDLIKCCPMCAVPIEKDEGCAQMMCKRCKHVFCWYCLASLDDDFLLRHYDKGPCKNKLGHSRASVVWHRAQVIGIFAGFGILLLVASPLLLLAAPCIICCKCRICSGSKVEEGDGEQDEATALQS